MRFRPCIDIHSGKVKQIVGSTLSDAAGAIPVTNFETDRSSAYFAGLYRSEGLKGGHVIMLGPGNETAAKEALEAFPQGLQIGGGITPDNAGQYLDAGASHVIVTSWVFSKGAIVWENLERIKKQVGKQKLVVDVSCKKQGDAYIIASDRWQTLTGVAVNRETLGLLGGHCDEFLVHAVDVEGKQLGVDAVLVGLLADISPVPVTYAGGIRSIDDMESVRRAGKGRVDATVGSALDIFGGKLKYKDVVEWQNSLNKAGTK
jgi:phosphoribosylformimino-5-aminoimidazole carboxamide ribotide isomerase